MAALPSSHLHPPLENGDRLTQPEFHRIYELHPDLEHVQLIEGIVYLASPIRIEHHGEPQGIILGWLAAYAARRKDVRFAGPSTVILDGDNEPEPDAMLFLTSDRGRASVIDEYVTGAPELVVEISGSSASIDLGPKKNAYRRNGVREYIVWATHDNRLFWFELVEGNFVELSPDADGIIRSNAFAGLSLNVAALLDRDIAGVLASLDPE